MSQEEYDAIVVGGGFFGCKVALELANYFPRVLLVEREDDLMARASWANQARVHQGYHYPRSFLTALRSRTNFPLFAREYASCIDSSFEKYYAIARQFSKVSLRQFEIFCTRIDAPLEPAPASVAAYFNPQLVEGVFAAIEWAFDADKLRGRLWQELRDRAVEVRLRTAATHLQACPGSGLALMLQGPTGETLPPVKAGLAFNCTYSALNRVLAASELSIVPLKHELTEMAVVEVPPALQDKGITVMCGPFFSLMPFPPRHLHTLSHVRYTPHYHWYDRPGEPLQNAVPLPTPERPYKSHFPHAIRDASRYLPMLRESRYVDSIWEIKTVLPQSEMDDSRPILLQRDRTLPGVFSILGGKIDNVYDLPQELRAIALGGQRVGQA